MTALVVARVGLFEVTVELSKHIFLSLEWSQIMVSFFFIFLNVCSVSPTVCLCSRLTSYPWFAFCVFRATELFCKFVEKG